MSKANPNWTKWVKEAYNKLADQEPTIPQVRDFIKQHHGERISTSRISEIAQETNVKRNASNQCPETRERKREFTSTVEEHNRLLADAYRGIVTNPVVRSKFPCEVLGGDDPHGVYWNRNITETMLKREPRAKLVILFEAENNDATGPFKCTYRTNTEAELKNAVSDFFDMLLDSGKQPVVGLSNHSLRPLKMTASRTRNVDEVVTRWKAHNALLKECIKRHKHIWFIPSYVLQVGQALFSHFSVYRKWTGAAEVLIGNHCEVSAESRGLKRPFGAVVHNHMHRVGQAPWVGRRGMVYASGCQCYIPRYPLEQEFLSGSYSEYHMMNGYTKLVLRRDGSVDFTESRSIFLQWADLPPWAEKWRQL